MTSKQTWVLILTSVASLMVALDALVVATALSTIRLDLGASMNDLEWTVNAYGLSFAVLLMTGSVLGDRFGRRRVFTAGIALFTVASAACALAPDVGPLIAARTVQGVGAALVMPTAMTLLTSAFPPERRAWALGLFSALTGLAVVGGPLVGGAVAQGLSWEWIFWLNVPIGVLTIPFVLRRMPASAPIPARMDIGGLALLTGAALGLVWGLVRGTSAGWTSVEVVGTLAAGAVLTVAFVLWETRVAEPMLPMRLFRSRPFSAGNSAGFLLYASLYGTVFFVAQFLQTAQGYGPLGAGLRLLPWTATILVAAPAAGALIGRLGQRLFLVGGLALQAAGMGWIALIAEPGLPFGRLVMPMVVAGVGVSVAMPAAQTGVLGTAAPDEIGKASGTFNTLRQLGGAFGVALAASAFAATGGYTSAQAFADGFGSAMWLAAAMSLTGAIIGAGVPGPRPALVLAEQAA